MIVIEANYSKKLGLRGYSSHQYSVTLRAEITELSQVSTKGRNSTNSCKAVWTVKSSRPDFAGEVIPIINGNGHTNGNGYQRTIKLAE